MHFSAGVTPFALFPPPMCLKTWTRVKYGGKPQLTKRLSSSLRQLHNYSHFLVDLQQDLIITPEIVDFQIKGLDVL